MWGGTKRAHTYYICKKSKQNHARRPWYAEHPPSITVREDRLIEPIARFFTQRVFGPTRKILLADSQSIPQIGPTLDARRAAVEADLANLQRRQTNLMRELADHQTTGNLDFDTAWRAAIQDQFAATLAEQRDRTRVLDEITRARQRKRGVGEPIRLPHPSKLGGCSACPRRDSNLHDRPDAAVATLIKATSFVARRAVIRICRRHWWVGQTGLEPATDVL
jgi:site-specific DNA recombinase